MENMKCSFANLFAAVRHAGVRVGVLVVTLFAVLGLLIGVDAVSQWWAGHPVALPAHTAGRVVYALSALSLIGALTALLVKEWLGTLIGLVLGSLIGGVLFAAEAYRAWVNALIPGLAGNLLALFTVGRFPVRVRIELVPAQVFVGGVVLLGVVLMLVLMGFFAWIALKDMCEFGAKVRADEVAATRHAA